MGTGRALVAAALAAAALAGCGGGGDDEKTSDLPKAPKTIEFSTPAFDDGGPIPFSLTCDGEGTPPTLAWRAVPPGAVELLLVVQDPDAKNGTFTHWTAWGIAGFTGSGLAPHGEFPAGVKQGKNSAGKLGWAPPCPPKGDEAHHYIFTLYALPEGLTLEPGASPEAVVAAIKKPLGLGTFTGTYKR